MKAALLTLLAILKNLGVALDQALNCVVYIAGEWGSPDECLSARAWRVEQQHGITIWRRLIDALFFWDRLGAIRHCELAYLYEIDRRHMPECYQKGGDDAITKPQ